MYTSNTATSIGALTDAERTAVLAAVSRVTRNWSKNPVWDADDLVQSGVLAVLGLRSRGLTFESDAMYVAYASRFVYGEMRAIARTSLVLSYASAGGHAIPTAPRRAVGVTPDDCAAKQDASDAATEAYEENASLVEYVAGSLTDMQRSGVGRMFGVLGEPKELETREQRNAAKRGLFHLQTVFRDGNSKHISTDDRSLVDLSGQRNGYFLTAVNRIKDASKKKSARWICRCDCGRTLPLRIDQFRRNKSCGMDCFISRKLKSVAGKERERRRAAERRQKKGVSDQCA